MKFNRASVAQHPHPARRATQASAPIRPFAGPIGQSGKPSRPLIAGRSLALFLILSLIVACLAPGLVPGMSPRLASALAATASSSNATSLQITAAADYGSHTLVLSDKGTVYSWGDNSYGAVGGVAEWVNTATRVYGLSQITAISAGDHYSLALDKSGKLWAWGWNGDGQLGDGTWDHRNYPESVASLPALSAVAAGESHVLALAKDGSVWSWGSNDDGQLGSDSYVKRNRPAQVAGLPRITAIAAGSSSSLALDEAGQVWAWGNMGYGYLGIDAAAGNGTDAGGNAGAGADDEAGSGSLVPVRIAGLTGTKAIYAGFDGMAAIGQDGEVRVWGLDYSNTPQALPGLQGAASLSLGYWHGLALMPDNTIWMWGKPMAEPASNANIDWLQPMKLGTAGELADSGNIAAVIASNYNYSIAIGADGQYTDWLFDTQQLSVTALSESTIRHNLSIDDTQQRWLDIYAEYEGSPYNSEPSSKPPFRTGKLQEDFLADGLDQLNFLRYLAGLPHGVELDSALNDEAQHGAVLLAAADSWPELQPSKPQAMRGEFYDTGLKALERSISSKLELSSLQHLLESMYSVTVGAVASGMISQQWLLMPEVKKVGFGYAEPYSTILPEILFSLDSVDYDYLAWPNAGNFPADYASIFATDWFVTLNPAKYQAPDINELEMKIVRQSTIFPDPRESVLNKHTQTIAYDEPYLGVDGNTILFRPDAGLLMGDDSVTISITGLRDLRGKPATLDYRIDFFDLYTPDTPSAWAAEEVGEAELLALIPDGLITFKSVYGNPITRSEFSQLAIALVEAKLGHTISEILAARGKRIDTAAFTDTQDNAVLAAYALGIANGKGDRRFDPDGFIKREEAAAMLQRTAEVLGAATAGNAHAQQAGKAYADQATISAWAQPAVQFVAAAIDKSNGKAVMGGTSGNLFNPLGFYTLEQAIITIKRLFNAL